jgi:Lrp/AsnC family transcriptional regulator, regulator for asnA, asnC and gidA
MARSLDPVDRELVGLLGEDGRLTVADAAQRAGLSRPTVASRLKQLVADGVLKLAGLVDAFEVPGLTIALVGLTFDKYVLDEKVEQIATLPEVNWAAVVTGRYDVIAEVVTEDGMVGLYRFITESLHQVGEVRSSEMFVVMKARNKWMTLPRGMREQWLTARGRAEGQH